MISGILQFRKTAYVMKHIESGVQINVDRQSLACACRIKSAEGPVLGEITKTLICKIVNIIMVFGCGVWCYRYGVHRERYK